MLIKQLGIACVLSMSLMAQEHFKVKMTPEQELVSVHKEFTLLTSYPDNYTVVAKGNKKGLTQINPKTLEAQVIVPVAYEEVKLVGVDWAQVKNKGKWGVYDFKLKKIVFECKYDGFKAFSAQNTAFLLGDKWGLLNDKTGKEIVPARYDEIGEVEEGLARVKKNDKYGFIDTTGKEVIPLIYSSAGSFSEGLALVKEEDVYSLINHTGIKVTNCDTLLNKENGYPTTESAKFPGGEKVMMAYLRANIKYPQMAKESDIQGKCMVQFTVSKEGCIVNVKLKKDIGGGCGEEALRVVLKMPQWKPAMPDGKPVYYKVILPIEFSLH